MKILITGGAGFIGSNFIEYVGQTIYAHLYDVVVVDSLTYASDYDRCKELLDNSNFKSTELIVADISERSTLLNDHVSKAEVIFHFAAESHVDNSIRDASPFINSNIVGTQNMIDMAHNGVCNRFMHVSTDEVYGSLSFNDASSTEESPIAPNSPYSASKASSDLLVRSYVKTHGFPAITTRCCNSFGKYQDKEKLIPKMIDSANNNRTLMVYGTGENIREWIDVRDHCRAIWFLVRAGEVGEVYNIGTRVDKTNNVIVGDICDLMGYDSAQITHVEDRKGHDFRYSINSNKLLSLGFKPKYNYEETLRDTVKWYTEKKD